jgi:hypothetical protein
VVPPCRQLAIDGILVALEGALDQLGCHCA